MTNIRYAHHPSPPHHHHHHHHHQVRDHTTDAMWLGAAFPLDISVLVPDGGDDPQYPELGLGYSKRDTI